MNTIHKISDLMNSIAYQKIDKIDDADCFIFNTCHIRRKSNSKSLFRHWQNKKIYKKIRKNQFLSLSDV